MSEELVYVSWGGNGQTVALRTAFEAAVERDMPLVYLAVLDKEHFGDLDASYLSLVIDELEWLLEAQLRLVSRQLDAQSHEARILVRQGDVFDELDEVVKASGATLVLVPSDVAETAATIAQRTGAQVETV